MKSVLIRFLAILLCLCVLCPPVLDIDVGAVYYRPAPEKQENDPNDPDAAQNISSRKLITDHSGFSNLDRLFNNIEFGYDSAAANAHLTLEHSEGIGYLYLIFSEEYGAYTVTNNDTGASATVGENMFLHELIDLKALFGSAACSVTIQFAEGSAQLHELMVFTEGYLPEYVQVWEPAKEGETDLILFSTHGDDDQLFFAGLLPYYCALDYEVLVVYMVDHSMRQSFRLHEMLNGLWGCGVTSYPVFGPFNDFFEEDLSNAYKVFEAEGVSRDDIIEYVLTQLRKYKPMVAVGHDFGGEYQHAQHMVYADCLAAAVEISNDPTQYPELAEAYGVWDVPKTYLHMYDENPIIMDWDTPMEELDGYTPFEVTQKLGYTHHVSQRESWVSNWINGIGFSIEKASQITKYSPCEYGLYRTTVGADVEKNDLFENVLSHEQQAQKEEAERLAAEEAARLEAERLEQEAAEKAAAEEAARLEAERLEQEAAEEAARLEADRPEQEAQKAPEALRSRKMIILICIAAALILVAAVIPSIRKKKMRK